MAASIALLALSLLASWWLRGLPDTPWTRFPLLLEPALLALLYTAVLLATGWRLEWNEDLTAAIALAGVMGAVAQALSARSPGPSPVYHAITFPIYVASLALLSSHLLSGSRPAGVLALLLLVSGFFESLYLGDIPIPPMISIAAALLLVGSRSLGASGRLIGILTALPVAALSSTVYRGGPILAVASIVLALGIVYYWIRRSEAGLDPSSYLALAIILYMPAMLAAPHSYAYTVAVTVLAIILVMYVASNTGYKRGLLASVLAAAISVAIQYLLGESNLAVRLASILIGVGAGVVAASLPGVLTGSRGEAARGVGALLVIAVVVGLLGASLVPGSHVVEETDTVALEPCDRMVGISVEGVSIYDLASDKARLQELGQRYESVDNEHVAGLVVSGVIPGLVEAPGFVGNVSLVDLATNETVEVAGANGYLMIDVEETGYAYIAVDEGDGSYTLRMALELHNVIVPYSLLGESSFSPVHSYIKLNFAQPLIFKTPGYLTLYVYSGILSSSILVGRQSGFNETLEGVYMEKAYLGLTQATLIFEDAASGIGIPLEVDENVYRLWAGARQLLARDRQAGLALAAYPSLLQLDGATHEYRVEVPAQASAYINGVYCQYNVLEASIQCLDSVELDGLKASVAGAGKVLVAIPLGYRGDYLKASVLAYSGGGGLEALLGLSYAVDRDGWGGLLWVSRYYEVLRPLGSVEYTVYPYYGLGFAASTMLLAVAGFILKKD